MKLTPWSHALAEDPKRTTKQLTTIERTTKMRKNIVLGAHAGCTTDKSCVICGLPIKQVACTSTCGLYNWQVTYHTWVESIGSHVYQTRHATVQSASRVWVEKLPKKVKNCLRKAGEVCYQTYKVFLSGKKDLKQCKRLKEIKRNPKQTRLSLVESSVLL